jgi:carboxypeptidase family protein/TonB-dependent receptor-like protein
MHSVKAKLNRMPHALGWALIVCAITAAQTVTGTISGTVSDSAGGVIVGARVTLTSERTGDTRTLTTGEAGRFSFAALQPDVYTLRIEERGFRTLEKRGNVLSANETLALGELELKAGDVSETVTVSTGGDRVETESSDLTARLTSDQINLISTKGRDITSLLRLLPGTSNNDDIEAVGEGFGTDLPNISGQRGRSTVATIDGLNASEPSGSNKLSMTINQDAVAEVKVLRNNYAAEYGNNGGALINLVSKGGTRDYHGSGYYFLRNEALNASPFFNNKAGLPRPLYRHNIWGLNAGGPVQIPKLFPNKEKDKLFFFYSYEKPHTITPQDPRFVTMPTALERNGDFSQSVNSTNARVYIRDPLITTGNCNATDQSACFKDPSRASASNPTGVNIIPIARFNKSGQALLNYFPLPNTPGGKTAAGGAYNYVVQSPVDVPKRSQVIRFDARVTSKDTVYFKAQWWTSDNEGTGTSGWPGNDENRWGINSHYLYKDNGWSANWVHIFNPSVVNEFNFGMRHDSEGFIPSTGEIDKLQRSALNYTAPQLFPDNNRLGTIPRVTNWSGVLGTPANINWLDRWGEVGNDYIRPSFLDNLTVTRGTHSYKFGAYFEHMLNGEAPGGQWSGVFNFSGTDSAFTASLGNTGYAYANALIGNFDNYQESSSRPFTNLGLALLQWYAQDQWKISRQFTLNYGMRLGYHSQWSQLDNLASNFDPKLYDPAKAPLLYKPFCVGGTPATAACATANRRAIDPRTGQLFTNTNLVGTFVPGTGDPNNGLAIAGQGDTPRGFKSVQPIDFEPRVGFAWDISGRARTVVRGQFGVYHAPRAGGGTTGGNLVNNPPFQRNLQINFANIDNLVNLVGTALSSPTSLNAVESRSNTPTTYNISLGIQQDIGFKTVIEISFVGSFTRHLGERRDINQVPDTAKWINLHPENRNPFSAVGTNGPNQTGALADNFLRPYQGYSSITEVMYAGSSNYNGLQVQVNRRYTHGFQYGIAYTYSKTFDYANDDSSDVFNGRPYKAFNYGPADFDQTHIFTINYIWDVPGLGRSFDNKLVKTLFDGWQLSGTTSYASGKPKVFGSGTGLNWSFAGTASAINITDFTGGSINARPDVVFACDPNKPNGSSDPTGTKYVINPNCFAKPANAGDIGNLPRNSIRLPSTFNNDLAIFKNFGLGEKRYLQFRWETYNLFNRANFRDIDGSMTFDATGKQTNTRFGAPISARSPRVMQGSLRISF